jgi:hypothetical protein
MGGVPSQAALPCGVHRLQAHATGALCVPNWRAGTLQGEQLCWLNTCLFGRAAALVEESGTASGSTPSRSQRGALLWSLLLCQVDSVSGCQKGILSCFWYVA